MGHFSLCRSRCAPGSILRAEHGSFGSPLCLCSIDRYGVTCHLKRQCDPLKGQNPCLNNGKCHVRFDPDHLSEDYFCTCPSGFLGSQCQLRSGILYFQYNGSASKYFAAALVQLFDYDVKLNLVIRRQILFTNVWPKTHTIVYEKQTNPQIAIARIFETDGYVVEQNDQMHVKNLLYLLYIRSNENLTNITIIFDNVNHCPITDDMFNASGKFSPRFRTIKFVRGIKMIQRRPI